MRMGVYTPECVHTLRILRVYYEKGVVHLLEGAVIVCILLYNTCVESKFSCVFYHITLSLRLYERNTRRKQVCLFSIISIEFTPV